MKNCSYCDFFWPWAIFLTRINSNRIEFPSRITDCCECKQRRISSEEVKTITRAQLNRSIPLTDLIYLLDCIYMHLITKLTRLPFCPRSGPCSTRLFKLTGLSLSVSLLSLSIVEDFSITLLFISISQYQWTMFICAPTAPKKPPGYAHGIDFIECHRKTN